MKNIQTKKCDMNVDELKIKALLEGLEVQNIEKFMSEAKVADYRNCGEAYALAVKSKIKEQELLFHTEDNAKETSLSEDILKSACEHQMAELWYVTEDGEPFQLEHQSKCFICGYEDNRI